LALLRASLPVAERDELVADISAEFARRAAVDPRDARRWIWRQALGSMPAVVRWNWWRERTGFESRANAFRPGEPMLRTWITDAHYAVRRLRFRPGYSLLSILTLSLGIGGTAAVYGVAKPVLFEPLPYANASEVGTFWMSGSWNEEEYLFLRGKFPGFRAVAAYRSGDVTMRDGDAPTKLLPGIATSSEIFDVLGARPLLGRGFQAGDDVQGAEAVAVLSYGLWQELGGTASIVGTRVTLDGTPRTVVGVMPRGFWFPSPAIRIWVPRQLDPQGHNGSYTFVGRVAPGVDVHSLNPQLAQLTRIMGERFTYDDPKWDKRRNAFVTPIREELLGSMRPAVIATFVGMGLILLIACTNVAALMLGQVEGRASELAVRAALGATRRRIAQQLVIEALLVGIGAGAVGGALAAAGFGLMARALPIGAWADGASFDWTTFAFALAIAIGAALLVVLVPLVSLARTDLRESLSRARTSGIAGRGGRLERGLVIAEVALAMMVACGAALLARSVTNLYAIKPGFQTSNIAVVDFVVNSGLPAADRRRAVIELRTALAELPGVKSAAAALKIPLRGNGDNFDLTVQGRPGAPTSSFFRIVTLDYFETLGFRLVSGRTFTTGDRLAGELPVLINEELARRYFPGEEAIGKVLGGGYGVPQRVIGVVANAAEGQLTDPPEPARYFYAGTVGWMGPYGSFVIRANRDQDIPAILENARKTMQRVAPGFAVSNLTTMQRVFDTAVGPAKPMLALLGILSALALVLGAIGIYGVISHFAARRKRDWAIRVALGLPGSRVVRHIVWQGAALVAIGVGIGVVGTAAMSRLLSSLLFHVSAIDPLAFAAATVTLLAIGVAAAFVPAWKAGTVDPGSVLREQ
jgi:predicted permease